MSANILSGAKGISIVRLTGRMPPRNALCGACASSSAAQAAAAEASELSSRREWLPLLPCSGGLLVRALADAQLKVLLQHLCKRCTRVGKKVERRDIATIALKTVLEQISGGGKAAILVDVVTPSLITGIDTKVRALQFDTSMPQRPPAVRSSCHSLPLTFSLLVRTVRRRGRALEGSPSPQRRIAIAARPRDTVSHAPQAASSNMLLSRCQIIDHEARWFMRLRLQKPASWTSRTALFRVINPTRSGADDPWAVRMPNSHGTDMNRSQHSPDRCWR